MCYKVLKLKILNHIFLSYTSSMHFVPNLKDLVGSRNRSPTILEHKLNQGQFTGILEKEGFQHIQFQLLNFPVIISR